MPQIFISIGSNIDRENNIRFALSALSGLFADLASSSIYESQAMGFNGDPFYNLVVSAHTDNSLNQIQSSLASLEDQRGRDRQQKHFGPRTLDLDLLLYDEHIQHDGQLDLPRSEISRYAFVLGPLAELAPDLIHPETGKSFRQMWEEFDRDKSVIWLADYQPDSVN